MLGLSRGGQHGKAELVTPAVPRTPAGPPSSSLHGSSVHSTRQSHRSNSQCSCPASPSLVAWHTCKHCGKWWWVEGPGLPSAPQGAILLTLKKCEDLASADLNGYSDPYVVMKLGDGKHARQKSTIKHFTLNAEYNEKFEWFKVGRLFSGGGLWAVVTQVICHSLHTTYRQLAPQVSDEACKAALGCQRLWGLMLLVVIASVGTWWGTQVALEPRGCGLLLHGW